MAAESPDNTSERIDGSTANGGTYSVANFRAANGDPCPKAKAKQVEIIEYSAKDKVVGRHYGTIGGAS